MPLRDVSITRKLTGAILATALLVLALGIVLLGFRDIVAIRKEMARTTMLIAQAVGEYSVSELAFGDREESTKTLAKLGQMRDIEAVALYDEEGRLFSAYERGDIDHHDPIPADEVPPDQGSHSRFSELHVEAIQPVVYEGHRYGTIHLRASSAPLTKMIRAHVLSVVFIVAGLALLALPLAIAMQRAVSRPILELAALARRLSDEADYSIRVPERRRDEIGLLSNGFNSMLAAIERRQRERDVADTERKAAQEELRKLNEELEDRVTQRTRELRDAQTQLVQAAKMASLGTLTAGLAHEINNPVNYLAGNLSLMGDVYAQLSAHLSELEDPRLRRKVEGMSQMLADGEEAARRLKDLAQSLRFFSSPAESPLQLADLHRGIDSCLEILAPRLKDGVEVVRRYGELPPVPCRLGQLNQVFMNLIENAADAMQGKGRLTITTTPEEDSVLLLFADEGPGLSTEAADRLFDPFFTTKEVGEGLGLGLALSRTIVVKAHGGQIWARNATERGCEFSIRLFMSPDGEGDAHD